MKDTEVNLKDTMTYESQNEINYIQEVQETQAYKDENLWLMQGDCLERMKEIPDGSVDLILTDPPYGTVSCKWDVIIPLEAMWKELKRIIKPHGAIVLMAAQPFTSVLIASNLKGYKYNWVWDKKKPGGIGFAKYQPMRVTEDVCVFGEGTVRYYPLMIERDVLKSSRNYSKSDMHGDITGIVPQDTTKTYTHKYPKNIIEVSNANQRGKVHPTQKPVLLMEYLIKTYTTECETVLDFTMGSGTTGVACVNTKRKFIGIEMDTDKTKYFDMAKDRIISGTQKGCK